MKFCVVALPRSRTAWLAAWLGVEHEPLSRRSSFAGLTDCVDSASVVFFGALHRLWPDARYLFVFRDPDQIAASCRRVGIPTSGHEAMVQAQQDAYESVRGQPNVMAVQFDRLSDMDTLEAIRAHLVGGPFDADRARELIPQNIQNVSLEYDAPQLELLLAEAKEIVMQENL